MRADLRRPRAASARSSRPTGTAGRTRSRQGCGRCARSWRCAATAVSSQMVEMSLTRVQRPVSIAVFPEPGDKMQRMPGTNLTRDEARARADLLDVESYTSSSTSTDVRHHDFGSTTVIRFALLASPAPPPSPTWSAPRSTRSALNGASARPRGVYPDNRIRLDDLAADNELRVVADCAFSRTGEGLHRFVDPADDRVYTYTQFEVPDARRVYTTFEQPDLKATFTFTVTRPGALEGRLQRAHARARPRRARARRRGPSPTTERMSTYITALVAGEYHEVRDTYEGRHGDDPPGPLLPAVDEGAPRRRGAPRGHQAGLRVLRGRLRLPLPVRQVRPALRAGVQHGRDGERRLRHLPRRVPPAQPPGPLLLRAARQHDPPRDGAHVVRRPRHHAVVGRPVAQRVVRRVGLAPRLGRRPPGTPRRGPASPTPARTGPTARTSCPRPTRSPRTTTTSRRSR